MTIEMPEVQTRKNVRLAATWTAVSELLRRHQAGAGLRILELHPGGGQYDGIGVLTEELDRQLCFFHTAAEHLHVHGSLGTPRTRLDELGWPHGNNYVQRLLCAGDSKNVVDEIEALLGLPKLHQTRASTPATVTMRGLASLCARHAFSRMDLDVRCGWYDSSGEGTGVRDWVRGLVAAIDHGLDGLGPRAPWRSAARVASRLWRVTSSAPDCRGVVLDLKDGSLYTPGQRRRQSLWDAYRSRHRIDDVAAAIEASLWP